MTGFSLWYGVGVPEEEGARGGGLQLVEGKIRVMATDGQTVVTRQTDVEVTSGDRLRISFGARFVDVHRNEAFVTRLWLAADLPRWFAGCELVARCP